MIESPVIPNSDLVNSLYEKLLIFNRVISFHLEYYTNHDYIESIELSNGIYTVIIIGSDRWPGHTGFIFPEIIKSNINLNVLNKFNKIMNG